MSYYRTKLQMRPEMNPSPEFLWSQEPKIGDTFVEETVEPAAIEKPYQIVSIDHDSKIIWVVFDYEMLSGQKEYNPDYTVVERVYELRLRDINTEEFFWLEISEGQKNRISPGTTCIIGFDGLPIQDISTDPPTAINYNRHLIIGGINDWSFNMINIGINHRDKRSNGRFVKFWEEQIVVARTTHAYDAR